MKKYNQKGFTAVEGLLIAIIVLMIGFIGYYVYHSQQQANKTLNSAQAEGVSTSAAKKTSTSGNASSATRYFTISQWGVRAPYSGTDSFTFSYSAGGGTSALVISSNLAKTYGCTTFGAGQIAKSSADDPANDPANPSATVGEDITSNPSMYTKVGSYYYSFAHDNAACSDSVTVDAQNAANDTVKALVAKLQIIPQ